MNEQELLSFIDYYNKELDQMKYNLYTMNNNKYYVYGLLPKMYMDNNPILLSLLSQPCNHDELKKLLMQDIDDLYNSELYKMHSDHIKEKPIIFEPLVEWIYKYNYMLAYPLLKGDKNDRIILSNSPERVLSYVYILLRIQHSKKNSVFSFEQPTIDNLYTDKFDKSSTFEKWKLIPIDSDRVLCANDDPVRIYDKSINHTVFIMLSRPLALAFDKLMKNHYINNISFRGIDNRVYKGENHNSTLCEAVENGMIFTFDLKHLPTVTKLYRECCFEDTLWILKDDYNITFEELCKNFHTEEDTIVTQMIHLEYDEGCITHLDHEYIFYTLEEYDQRIHDPYAKGKARKRVKTFKIDKSSVPMDYPCTMYIKQGVELEKVEVPFIYFVLNNYFEHKELLEEYFSKCLTEE